MKNIKKLALLLSVTILATSLAACGQAKPAKSSSVATSQSASSSKADSSTAATTTSLSDDLYDFQASVNGVSYKFPAAFSEFAKNGWKGESFDTKTLTPNHTTLEQIKNGDMILSIHLVNTGNDTLAYSKCDVGGVSIDSFDAEKGVKIVMAKGITLGSAYDKIIAAYGNPSSSADGGTLKSMTYETDTYSTVRLSVDTSTNKLDSIDIENLVASKNTSSSSNATNTSLPDSVKNYKAPTSLSNDLYSFQVKYGGALYQLPAPVAEFVKNGWKIQSDASKIVPAQDSLVGVELRKDNQVLRTTVQNYSDKGAPISGCFITDVMYDIYQTTVPLELPKGINKDSTLEQIKAAYGAPTKTEDSSSSTYYLYGKIWQQVEIYISKDTKKISKIAVEYSPKTLK